MPASFFDSNVLLYLASREPDKATKAEQILTHGGSISVQVLNEVANVARRKMRLSWRETHEFLSLVRALLVVHPVTIETHEDGLVLAERYGLATCDAMIVAAALRADCETLWSEDLQHGMLLDRRLRVVNPFRAE